MATILRKLPICTEPKTLQLLGGASIAIKRDQIVLWVSVTQPGLSQFPTGAPQIPAVLDTGFNSTFLIAEKQLHAWAAIAAKDLTWIDLLTADGQPIPLRNADVWIHPNRPHTHDTIPGGQPFRLELAEASGSGPAPFPAHAVCLCSVSAPCAARVHMCTWTAGRVSSQ